MGTTLAESLGRFYEGNARKRRTTMSAKRNKMTKDEETALFQKAMEAMRLFDENPDLSRRATFPRRGHPSMPRWTGGAKETAQRLIAIEFLRTRKRSNRAGTHWQSADNTLPDVGGQMVKLGLSR
jgi:hypothetical protein